MHFLRTRQFEDLTWPKFLDCKTKCRDKRKKIRKTICPGPKNNNGEGPIVQPLLFRQTLVYCDQYIEVSGHGTQQGTVIEIAPTHLLGCFNLVHRQLPGKASRDTTIKKNSHTGLCGYRIGKKRRLGKFQYGDSVLAGNAWKVC
ncbi:MAG: hypothetical protein ACRER2_04665 [Methylococcales bacterium]